MWTKIKSWFKKDKPTPAADRVEATFTLPPKQTQRFGKSSQVKSTPTYTATNSQPVDTSFQDLALTYLLLDSFSDNTPSASDSKPVTFSVPEPAVQSYTSEPSTSSYSSSGDDSGRYSSYSNSSSDYSSSSSSSDYSSDSSSSSSYSSD